MARTVPPHRVLSPQPGSRPDLARWLAPGRRNKEDDASLEEKFDISSVEDKFHADMGTLEASQIDEKSVVLYAPGWLPDLDYFEDFIDESSPFYRSNEDGHAVRFAWKTTCVYEQIGESHPHLACFDRRDPWTGFPIFKKPSGPTLKAFLEQHRATMYPDSTAVTATTSTASGTRLSRIEPHYHPLVYQWALHILSALSFAHSHEVVFGDLNVDICWLSSSLSLSLLGFLDAVYYDKVTFIQHDNDYSSWGSEPFHPCNVPNSGCRSIVYGDSGIANIKTDLFLWGCLVYELMTGHWPCSEAELPGYDWRDWRVEAENRLNTRQWPPLQGVNLGAIIRKCWEYQYEDTADLRRDLVMFLEGEGWVIDGDDLHGFNATELFET